MGDWLGTGTIAAHLRKYRSFEESRAFARSLGLSSVGEWRAHCKANRLPPDIPTNPNRQYLYGAWTNWADWLGTTTIATNRRRYRSYYETRSFVHSLGLKSANEWRAYTKSGKLPKDIPAGPNRTYAKKGGQLGMIGSEQTRLGSVNIDARPRCRVSTRPARRPVHKYLP
jgi:hypothetical protein